jgi:hypothetical protein
VLVPGGVVAQVIRNLHDDGGGRVLLCAEGGEGDPLRVGRKGAVGTGGHKLASGRGEHKGGLRHGKGLHGCNWVMETGSKSDLKAMGAGMR